MKLINKTNLLSFFEIKTGRVRGIKNTRYLIKEKKDTIGQIFWHTTRRTYCFRTELYFLTTEQLKDITEFITELTQKTKEHGISKGN